MKNNLYIVAVENGKKDDWSGIFRGDQVNRVIRKLVARGMLRGKRKLVVEPF